MKLASYFQNGSRDGGSQFVKLTDDAPEWLVDAVREACDSITDWEYEECRAIASEIDDGSVQDEDDLHMYADSRVEIYTKPLFQWMADHCLTNMFAQAQSEYEDSGSDETDMVKRAMGVQYYAIHRIASIIFQAWQENRDACNREDET